MILKTIPTKLINDVYMIEKNSIYSNINKVIELTYWYLSAIEINRYPGCTTRTSVPSQPIYKKKKSIRSILVKFLKLLELTSKSPSRPYKINKRSILVKFLKLLELTSKSPQPSL